MRRELNPYESERAYELSLGWLELGIPAEYSRQMAKEDALISAGGPMGIPHVAALKSCVDMLDSQPRTILDVGAGLCRTRKHLGLLGVSAAYTGIDVSHEFVRVAKEAGENIVLGDASDLPFPDKTFDLVISNYCLIHIYDWRKAIAEAARVASEAVVLHRLTFWRHCYTGRGIVGAYGTEVLFNCFAWKDFDAAVRSAGLMVKKMVHIGEPSSDGIGHYSALCTREK